MGTSTKTTKKIATTKRKTISKSTISKITNATKKRKTITKKTVRSKSKTPTPSPSPKKSKPPTPTPSPKKSKTPSPPSPILDTEKSPDRPELYRDILITKVPPNTKWFTPNIAYRRSTGTSNEFCEGKIDTNDLWVPTFGVLDSDKLIETWKLLSKSTVPFRRTHNTNYYITKIGHIFLIEFMSSLSFNHISILHQYNLLSPIMKTIVNKDKELVKLIELNDSYNGLIYCLLNNVFPNYFMDWYQLQISAFIGGDFWKQIPELKEYILWHDIPPIS